MTATTSQRGKLPRKQEQAITALLASATIAEAAKATGISERTLLRWLKDAEFQESYREAKGQMLAGTINLLRKIGRDGVAGLHEVVTDKASPPAARVSAGRAILEVLLRATELQDVEARLVELEKRAATLGERGGS